MRPFENVEEAEAGVGRVEVCAGVFRGILKSVKTTEPMAVIAPRDGPDFEIPLRALFLLEPGD